MAKIEKSEESGPLVIFQFYMKLCSTTFLGAPWAEKMTFSQKKLHVFDLLTHIP